MIFHIAFVRDQTPVATVPVTTDKGWLNEAYTEARRRFPMYDDCTLIVIPDDGHELVLTTVRRTRPTWSIRP